MKKTGVSTMTTQRIDRLLRSLVGVADVCVVWKEGTFRSVHILRHSGTQPHQLVRNIVSGLHAGFGLQVLPTQVHVHDDAEVFAAIDDVAHVLDAPDAHAAPGQSAAGNGAAPTNGSADATNGSGAAHIPAASASGASRRRPRGAAPSDNGGSGQVARPSAAPAAVVAAAAMLAARAPAEPDAVVTLERIDVERRTGTLRCRTVLAHGERRYSAIAEVPDSPSAEAELAARVAVDALRAGGLTNAMLDGVGFITINRTNYCVATVRESSHRAPRAGAAPLTDSMAASATAAVLTALGSLMDGRAPHTVRAGT
jgi:hypothetical protein